MSTRNCLTLGMVVLLLGPTPKVAASDTIVGAVTGVFEDWVQVRTNHGAERAVTLDRKTRYVRWITHQPWQQRRVADWTLLRTGGCASVELRAGEEHAAKLVRINTDGIGTIYCPCRSVR